MASVIVGSNPTTLAKSFNGKAEAHVSAMKKRVPAKPCGVQRTGGREVMRLDCRLPMWGERNKGDMKDTLDFIRNHWFKEHVAQLHELDNGITVLDWHKPGTCVYRMRYVFDRNYVYISGDVGKAVYCLTEEAKLDRLATYDTSYFTGKLSCSSRGKDTFDSEKAVSQIRDRLKERIEHYGVIAREQRKVYLDLIEGARSSNSIDAWKAYLYLHYEEISEVITECECWVFDVGKTLSSECIGYLEGLKMAHAQLSKRGK